MTAAGPRLRCFLGVAIVLATLNARSSATAQVDCISPAPITVSRVQGQVFDPTGAVVPGVVISLVGEGGSTLQVTTDQQGRFQLSVSPGRYILKAVVPMFQMAAIELNVKEDVNALNPSGELRVILGLGGSFCPWVTTSNREFQQIIRANKKRIEESAQRNATQK